MYQFLIDFLAEKYCIMWIYRPLSLDVHLACLQFGAIINNAAVKIHVQLWTYVFLFPECIHKSGIVVFLVSIMC